MCRWNYYQNRSRMKLIEKIMSFITDIRFTLYVNRIERKAKDPHTYKMWEHKGWGNAINVCGDKKGKFNSFQVVGWLRRRPNVGDYLIFDCEGGKKARGIFSEVKYEDDPHDMFFGRVVPLDYYEETE